MKIAVFGFIDNLQKLPQWSKLYDEWPDIKQAEFVFPDLDLSNDIQRSIVSFYIDNPDIDAVFFLTNAAKENEILELEHIIFQMFDFYSQQNDKVFMNMDIDGDLHEFLKKIEYEIKPLIPLQPIIGNFYSYLELDEDFYDPFE